MTAQNFLPTSGPRIGRQLLAGATAFGVAVLAVFATSGQASAAGSGVDLGTAGSYSVLGGQTVTNTGPSTLDRGVGVSPGSAITGFPPGLAAGATHAADAEALQAQSDLVIAFDDAAGRPSDATVAGDLVGLTLTPGTYTSNDTLAVTGTLTLDAQNDSNAVFIFQVASDLTTGSASQISLLNGAQACHVYWQVGRSATLGTESDFVGTVLALTSITATTGTTIDGRLLARNAAVTLDNNAFVSSDCDQPDTETSTESTDTSTTDTSTTSTTGTTDDTDGTLTEEVVTTGLETSTDTSTDTSTETSEVTDTPITTSDETSTAITTDELQNPFPPDQGGSNPPLAFTGSGPETIPVLIAGLVLIALGSFILWRSRTRVIRFHE